MAIDRIKKISSSSALRAATLDTVPFAYAMDTDRFVSKDEVGTARTFLDSSGGVIAKEFSFTETAGAGTYTASVVLPAGATVLDIIVNGVALWDNAGTATLIAGDGTDPDGYFTAVNLKATDLLAGESISFALAGGKAGAYIANSQVSPRYNAAAATITVSITTASTGGTAGRTRATVVYSGPGSTDVTAATKA